MEGRIARVLDRGRRVVVDARKRKASRCAAYLLRGPRTVASQLKESSVKLGKRKKPDNCTVKCRGGRRASQKSLYRCYFNFMKSRVPSRLMFFQNDEWVDLPSEILCLVKKDFELKKGVTEVNINDSHLLLDFLHMIHLDVKIGLEQPLAWVDEAGSCFFPEVFAFDNVQDGCCPCYADKDNSYLLSRVQGQHEIKLQIDIELNGVNDTPTMEYCGELNPLIKRVKIAQLDASYQLEAEVGDNCDRVSYPTTSRKVEHKEKNLDMKIQSTNETLAYEDVRKMFLKGMNPASGVDIISISRCSGSMVQARMELFQKQVEITKKYRGHANVRYAWLVSSKETLSSIMTYGLSPLGLSKFESSYGIGVHLTDANCSGTSVKYCDVDENGARHMILCGVIMGNMEMVDPGSKQFHPSGENFDNGVDDLDNPQQYIVWSMNINTHIYPEFVVSFKISPVQEGNMLGSDKLEISGSMTGQQSPELQSNVVACVSLEDMRSDFKSNLTYEGCKDRAVNLNSNPKRTPKSPWMPFPVLFDAIANKISADDMKLIFAQYELLRTEKIPRVEFIRTLRRIVGDPVLRTAISTLQSKGPSENKSVIEVPKQEAEG